MLFLENLSIIFFMLSFLIVNIYILTHIWANSGNISPPILELNQVLSSNKKNFPLDPRLATTTISFQYHPTTRKTVYINMYRE